MEKKIKLGVAGIFIAIAGYFLGGATYISKNLGGFSNLQSYRCTVSTASVKTVGNQASTQLLATSSRRAWAIIETPSGATNTVSLMLNQDVKATVGAGILINATTTNASYPVRQELQFGLNADMPYTGSVQGITNYGSSTAVVTECVY